MRTRLSSTNPARMDRISVDKIPPIAPRAFIEATCMKLQTFFSRSSHLTQITLPPQQNIFNTRQYPDYTPQAEELKRLAIYIRKSKKQMFKYLPNHPEFCHLAVSQIPMKFFKTGKRKNFFYELLQIAIYADSLELFKLAVIDTVQPPPHKKYKAAINSITTFIENNDIIPGLYIEPKTKIFSYTHESDDSAPTATCIAASPSEIFVGKNGGLIRVFSITNDILTTKYSLFVQVNEPYSLAWTHGFLWILTQTKMFQINPILQTADPINKPKDLIPPMCSDGHYFYCVKMRSREVNIFSFNGEEFIQEKHIRLGCPIANTYVNEHKIPFIADGGLISFAIQRGKDTNFRYYSLANGKWIHDQITENFPHFSCWALRNNSKEHIIFSPTDLTVFSGCSQIPRWMIGLSFPQASELTPVISSLELALYHGTPFFTNGSAEDLSSLINHYCASNDDIGVRTMGHILMYLSGEGINSSLTCISEYYYKCIDKPLMQHFCCFVFLSCYSKINSTVKPTILSDYFEKSSSLLDFIFIFPSFFDMKNTSLSPTAIKNIIMFTASHWSNYPTEASYIIQSYCHDYLECRVAQEGLENYLDPIGAILQSISQDVQLLFKNQIRDNDFLESPQFDVWGFMLKLIMNSKESWQSCSHRLIRMLQIGLLDQRDDGSTPQRIKSMMNRTLFLLLEVLFTSPYRICQIEFSSIDQFYKEFPHILNGVVPEIDKKLIALMNKAYDISSRDEYANHLFKIRRTVIFELKSSTKLLDAALETESLSANGLLCFLHTGEIKQLLPIKDHHIMEWFFNTLNQYHPVFTAEQEIIFSIYVDKYCLRIADSLIGNTELIASNIQMYKFPYIIPAKILKHSGLTFPIDTVLQMNIELLASTLDNIIEIFPQIEDTYKLSEPMLTILDHNSRPANIASPEAEPEHYRSVLLWLIPILAGAEKNFDKVVPLFPIYFSIGTPRIIEALLKGIIIAEEKQSKLNDFFKFILNLLANYFVEFKSYFVMQTEPFDTIVSIFIIIQALRQMFNSKSGNFRNYIISYIENCTDEEAIAVYAILNNSMETVKNGSEIHFKSKDMIEISGIISKLSTANQTFQIDDQEYGLSTCSQIWCKCPVSVKLHSLEDFKPFINLFLRTQYSTNHLRVIYYASLYEFMNHKRFIRHLPHDFKKMMYKYSFSSSFSPENYWSDFFSYISLSTSNTPPITFTDVQSLANETTISPIIQNTILNTRDYRNKKTGIIMTLEEPIQYVSSPIHPFCNSTLTLTLYQSEPNLKKAAVTLVVYGISRISNLILKSDTSKIQCKIDENTVISVKFSPCDGYFTITIDDIVKSQTAISPSIEMLYITMDILPSMYIEYKYDYDNEIQQLNIDTPFFAFKESPVMFMKTAPPPFPLPLADSSLYNMICLQKSSESLISCFRQLITIKIIQMSHHNAKPTAKTVLSLLSSSNSFPEEESLDLNKLVPSHMWKDSGKLFLDFIIKYTKTDDPDFVQQILKKYKKLMKSFMGKCISSFNQSALFIRKKQSFPVSNCSIMSNTASMALKNIGFSKDLFECGSNCVIIPFNNFHHTCIDLVLYTRFVLMFMVMNNNFNFTPIFRMIEKVSKTATFIPPLFHKTIELMHVISPPVPAPPNFPVFNDVSFFIKESIVHHHPDLFLIPRFVDYLGSAHVFSSNMPAAFNIPNAQKVYFAIRSKTIIETPQHFEVEEENDIHEMTNDSFIILNTSDFHVRCLDPKYQEDAVEFIIVSNPDISSIAKEINHWEPHHSHQLLGALPNDMSLSSEIYHNLPLSTIFSLKTAQFALAIIRNANINSALYRYRSHLLKPVTQKSKQTGLRIMSLTPLISDDYDMSDKSPILFDHCKKIADYSSQSPSRIEYLKNNTLDLFSMIEPDGIRINPEAALYPMSIRSLKSHLERNLIGNQKGTQIEVWLQNYISKMPNIVVLIFIEFCTGRWGTKALQTGDTDAIYIYFVGTEETIETIQSEHILVLGQFSSEKRFKSLLMKKIQQFNDSQFHSPFT